MRKVTLTLLLFMLALAINLLAGTPKSHADYFQYPCTYPFVGTSADVQVIAHGGGEYCDGPTEINGTHYHCMSGGGGIGGGAIGFAPIGPVDLGGFGGSGVGMNLADCHYVCPDLFRPPDGMPNPPAAWIKPLTVSPVNNICRDHMAPAGPDGAPVPPAQPDGPLPPGRSLPPGRPVPEAPVPPPAGGPPLVTVPDDAPSPLTPGGPLPLP